MIPNTPAIHHFFLGVRRLNTPTESERPALPSDVSASITGMPISSMLSKYNIMKAAPPFSWVRLGKRHTLPNPTADPTVAAMTPILELNVELLLLLAIVCAKMFMS